MGKLYTLLTDRNGHYALKLDKEFLYRTDDTVNGDNYAYVVDNFKSDKELEESEFASFVAKCVGKGDDRPKWIE